MAILGSFWTPHLDPLGGSTGRLYWALLGGSTGPLYGPPGRVYWTPIWTPIWTPWEALLDPYMDPLGGSTGRLYWTPWEGLLRGVHIAHIGHIGSGRTTLDDHLDSLVQMGPNPIGFRLGVWWSGPDPPLPMTFMTPFWTLPGGRFWCPILTPIFDP